MLGHNNHLSEKEKEDSYIAAHGIENEDDLQQVEGRDYNPAPDKRDMRRLGKKQELKRRFRFFSIVGYVIVLGLTWEFTIVTVAFNLVNGGTAGAIWLTLAVCFGMGTVCLSMAEIASMAPTSGGQYHWVSEFAPPSMQKQFSYAVGWLVGLGWQTAMPTVAYVAAQQVQALIVVCNDGGAPVGWQGSLLTMAFVLAAIFFNTTAIGKLPVLEGLAVCLHIFGFFAFLIIFWIFGPKAPADVTFTTFADDNNWGNLGLATLIGIVGPTTTYLGSDSAVHLAEELKDASYVLPRAMVTAAIINYVLGFVMTISFVFNIDPVAIANDTSGQPYVATIYSITGSKAATIVLIVVMIILYFFCAVNQVTTSSRQVFAFARDKGLPGWRWLSRVNAQGVPTRSVFVTLIFTCLLALIIIGSTQAFGIILSLSATGLFTSYFAVIGSVLVRRLRKQPFPVSKFNLGWYGNIVNILALCFLTVTFVFLFFPQAPSPDYAGFNWAILIYGFFIAFSFVYYLIWGRHEYDGPVTYVNPNWNQRWE